MALSNSISNIFGVSPIKPLQNHMAEVIKLCLNSEIFLMPPLKMTGTSCRIV